VPCGIGLVAGSSPGPSKDMRPSVGSPRLTPVPWLPSRSPARYCARVNSQPAPRLRIVYRSHGGENMKSRPAYYSKLLALASVVRAAEESGVPHQLVFWNDGPIPADRLELMRAVGEVARIDAGSNRESYRAAIDMAAGSDWSPADLVWFAEDDYLYRPTTFGSLMAAEAAIPDADYLSVFGGWALDVDSPMNGFAAYPRWGSADVPDPVRLGDVAWFRGVSTTSTYGARTGRCCASCPTAGGRGTTRRASPCRGGSPSRGARSAPRSCPSGRCPPRDGPRRSRGASSGRG